MLADLLQFFVGKTIDTAAMRSEKDVRWTGIAGMWETVFASRSISSPGIFRLTVSLATDCDVITVVTVRTEQMMYPPPFLGWQETESVDTGNEDAEFIRTIIGRVLTDAGMRLEPAREKGNVSLFPPVLPFPDIFIYFRKIAQVWSPDELKSVRDKNGIVTAFGVMFPQSGRFFIKVDDNRFLYYRSPVGAMHNDIPARLVSESLTVADLNRLV